MSWDRPTVERGGAAHWPAAHWTLDTLAQRAGDAVVPVHTGRWRRAGWRVRRDGPTRAERARDYLEALAVGEAVGYMAGHELFSTEPSLKRDLGFPGTGPLSVDVLWVGPEGTVTPVHRDWVPNLYAQLLGRKRWRLWPPDHPMAGRWAGLGFTMSNLDVHDGVSRAGPPAVDVVLEPGDLLHIPAWWWHRVDSLETAVAVNHWWKLAWLEALVPRFGGRLGSSGSSARQ